MKAGLKHINGRVEEKLEARFEKLASDPNPESSSRSKYMSELDSRLSKTEEACSSLASALGSNDVARRDWVREALREALSQEEVRLFQKLPQKDWVLEQVEQNYDSLKQFLGRHVEDALQKDKDEKDKEILAKGKGAPVYVTDLWDSVGQLAARLTDMQVMLDDLYGSKKVGKLRRMGGRGSLETPR